MLKERLDTKDKEIEDIQKKSGTDAVDALKEEIEQLRMYNEERHIRENQRHSRTRGRIEEVLGRVEEVSSKSEAAQEEQQAFNATVATKVEAEAQKAEDAAARDVMAADLTALMDSKIADYDKELKASPVESQLKQLFETTGTHTKDIEMTHRILQLQHLPY